MSSRAQLFIGRLPTRIKERDIENVFEKYGTLIRCDVKHGAGTSYAFVDYEDRRDAEDAIRYENGREIGGQSIVVEWAKGPSYRSRGGGGGFQRYNSYRRESYSRSLRQNIEECYRCRRTGHWARNCPDSYYDRGSRHHSRSRSRSRSHYRRRSPSYSRSRSRDRRSRSSSYRRRSRSLSRDEKKGKRSPSCSVSRSRSRSAEDYPKKSDVSSKAKSHSPRKSRKHSPSKSMSRSPSYDHESKSPDKDHYDEKQADEGSENEKNGTNSSPSRSKSR